MTTDNSKEEYKLADSCAECLKVILQPGQTYGINPEAICRCTNPKPIHNNITIDWHGALMKSTSLKPIRLLEAIEKPGYTAWKADLEKEKLKAQIEVLNALDYDNETDDYMIGNRNYLAHAHYLQAQLNELDKAE